MTKAVEAGLPKLRIEEASAKKQARIDRGDTVIVGVNKYRLKQQDEIDILNIDNNAVREAQVARLNRMRNNRDEGACTTALENLTRIAKSGEDNILRLAIEAARERASVGEISNALESAWGRHKAKTKMVSGVYGHSFENNSRYNEVREEISGLEKELGRKPRILVLKMGQDGHDRGAKVISTAFDDLGYDVVVGPLFQTPGEAADLAVAEDVDIVGVSSHAAGHKTLAPMLLKELANRNAADKIVICGGVIPSQDYNFLKQAGVAAIYGPGTNILESAAGLIGLLREQMRGRNQ
jgi:methylmalonyl-CoA mutase